MLFPLSLSSTPIRAVVAIFATTVHLTAAGDTPWESNSGQDDAASILSMIDPKDKKDVAQFLQQSSSPNPVSMLECVKANNDTELSTLINESGKGDEIRLCPGIVDFHNEIELTKSVTIICAGEGPNGACILDGNEDTRHFASIGKTVFAFIGLTFINGFVFVDDGSSIGPTGGSLNLLGGSTNILTGCLFYNNRVTSSSDFAGGGAIFAFGGETVVNNCLFLDNVAETTAASESAEGGALSFAFFSNLKVSDSVFKNNKALQVTTPSDRGGGGAIFAILSDVLVLSSVFELNEASNDGGAAQFGAALTSVDWYNNKDLLFGNDAGEDCDGVAVGSNPPACSSVGDNFSFNDGP